VSPPAPATRARLQLLAKAYSKTTKLTANLERAVKGYQVGRGRVGGMGLGGGSNGGVGGGCGQGEPVGWGCGRAVKVHQVGGPLVQCVGDPTSGGGGRGTGGVGLGVVAEEGGMRLPFITTTKQG
jgi:hypothetical protein